jgi:CDGSH-type Zn-finger protein
MPEPVIAQVGPYPVDVTEGRTYYWCACGRSKSQPFCDGSHKDTEFTPVEYVAGKARTITFCGCKRTNRKPVCDGSHNQL